jgi:PIN domain nuclease of toxin-antitoxin system
MQGLLDTHILLWIGITPSRIPTELRQYLEQRDNELLFSTASIWEIAIKHSLGREDFQAEPSVLRRNLLSDGYVELPVSGEHAVAVATLPRIHRDPFDRMLVAQAIVEGVELLTVDGLLARYPGPVRLF